MSGARAIVARRVMPWLATWALVMALVACAAPATSPVPAAAAPGGTDTQVLRIVDRSCRVDSDCTVKNVGNCCGYFPACVNSAAQPDPDAVQAHCADTGMAAVCGFQDIQACSCVQARCEADPTPQEGIAR